MNEKAIVYSALSIRSVPTRIPAPQKAPFYLSELVAESLSLIPHEGIEVETGIEPTDTMLYADRVLMSQVMVNLLKKRHLGPLGAGLRPQDNHALHH